MINIMKYHKHSSVIQILYRIVIKYIFSLIQHVEIFDKDGMLMVDSNANEPTLTDGKSNSSSSSSFYYKHDESTTRILLISRNIGF